ncbi:MAG: multiubiquitin domain-containing protein [Candidatus Aminicenantes bacterium]|nr:multiubiquitin domain-containing protein [Candidatus Aminicenantes bacterium]
MTTQTRTTEDLRLKTVTIEVNGHKVEMPAGPASGLEIKEAAIKQGVKIQENFVLQVQLPNGSSRVIGNDDKIPLTEHLSFTAIAADDNS